MPLIGNTTKTSTSVNTGGGLSGTSSTGEGNLGQAVNITGGASQGVGKNSGAAAITTTTFDRAFNDLTNSAEYVGGNFTVGDNNVNVEKWGILNMTGTANLGGSLSSVDVEEGSTVGTISSSPTTETDKSQQTEQGGAMSNKKLLIVGAVAVCLILAYNKTK